MSRKKTALEPSYVLEQEAGLELIRAYNVLEGEHARFFKSYGITGQQYNVLRILYVRDDGAGLPCQRIGERLVTSAPDLTRLLDRLERDGWIERFRPEHDRRVVLSRLTEAGWDLMERIHPALIDLERSLFGHMSSDDLKQLQALLKRARRAE